MLKKELEARVKELEAQHEKDVAFIQQLSAQYKAVESENQQYRDLVDFREDLSQSDRAQRINKMQSGRLSLSDAIKMHDTDAIYEKTLEEYRDRGIKEKTAKQYALKAVSKKLIAEGITHEEKSLYKHYPATN